MLPPWLSLKLIGIIGIAIVMAILVGLWQWERIDNGKLKNEIEALKGMVDSLNTQIAVRDTIIEDQKKNLEALKSSVDEMRDIIAKASVMRKKIKTLPTVQGGTACESSDKLGAEYAKTVNDITAFALSGVRGKITSKRYNSETAPESLPVPAPAGTN